MSDLNQVTILGNVGRDPDIRTFQSGDKIANLSVATNERWKDKQTGERKERSEWHNVVVRGNGLVGVVEAYVTKGSRLLVTGKLSTRKWQDQSGSDRYTTEILAREIGLQGKPEPRQQPAQSQSHNPAADLDDEIPF